MAALDQKLVDLQYKVQYLQGYRLYFDRIKIHYRLYQYHKEVIDVPSLFPRHILFRLSLLFY